MTTTLGSKGNMLRVALLAILVTSTGCAAPRSHVVPPGTAAGSLQEATDRFGYRAERERLIAQLEDARDPGEQARLTMELADLAERTRGEALARGAELEKSHDYAERAERDELGRLAQRLLDDELKQLERIAGDFREFPRRDEALYRLGYALLDRGSPDVALQHMRTLFAVYPTSPYVALAYLAFADDFFEKEDIDQAIKLYEKVIAFANPEATPRAHYQLGKCRIAKGEHAEALQSFVAAANAAQALGGQAGAALRDEALAELVKAYARVGAPEKALAFFERIGRDRIDDLLERLGAAYFDDGRFLESIVINRQVSDRVECSPVQARAHVAVFEARLYLGEIDDGAPAAAAMADQLEVMAESF